MTPRRRPVLASIALACAAAAVPLVACSGSKSDDAIADAGSADAPPPLDGTFFPDASCSVAIDSPPLIPAVHVAVGSDITTWDSNPPSSGPHYPIWAAYQSYATPVPRGYYVHNLEHGAIVMLYNCNLPGVDCAQIQSQLQQVSDALPDDPFCADLAEGVRVRTVITPDPLITVPVAAAAWGWTYQAQCFDLQSLVDFARTHYQHGNENLCNQGQSTF